MPEMTICKCPRCGEEVEIEEGEELSVDDGCDECAHWVKCDDCGEWSDDTTEVRGHGDICRSCLDYDYFCCERCYEYHHNDEAATVERGRRDDQTWCEDCRSSNAIRCDDCGTWYHNDYWDGSEVNERCVCNSCLESGGYHYCENCAEWWEGDCEQCQGQFLARRSYGDHGEFKVVKLRSPIAIGMEMEVGYFSDSSVLNDRWGEFGERFAYPTSDSSLDSSGVEFIGHPWDAWMHLSKYEVYEEFFTLMDDAGGSVQTHSSGCHMNVHAEAFGSEDAMRAAIVAVNRFRSALWKFTPSSTLSRRQGYAKATSFASGTDPLTLIEQSGKYSIANWKKGESLMEFRIPAMTLETDRFMAQIQLYHNLVAWSRGKCAADASTATFDEIFLPVLFQSSISDVVEAGRVVEPESIGDPT